MSSVTGTFGLPSVEGIVDGAETQFATSAGMTIGGTVQEFVAWRIPLELEDKMLSSCCQRFGGAGP